MFRKLRLQLFGTALMCALVALQPGPARPSDASPPHPLGLVNTRTCEERVNDTVAKLEECIRRGSLWNHLARFQRIADANPGPNGHGNRNTGTSGYRASVAYVAGLLRQAGYNVTIQEYYWRASAPNGTPAFRTASRSYAYAREWFVARGSGAGTLTAPIEPPAVSSTGCSARDYAGFKRGSIALVESGACAVDTQVANAEEAGAAAVILYNGQPAGEAPPTLSHDDDAFAARLTDPTNLPVIGVTAHDVAAGLLQEYRSGSKPKVHIVIHTRIKSGLDYNVIAEPPFGDPNHVVVLDAHLDSIFGAGMLDNASGSTTILEIALNLAKTPTRNRLRYIWFGGEELGLLGSHYYTKHLTPAELHRIVFDIDADVTATPNYDILVADPQFAHNHGRFPSNVIPQSRIGNEYFADFFQQGGVISRPARFGNDGTDSNAFSLVGVPNSGILTQQDCCKHRWETALWGGFLGNYEGAIPSHNGGCVDNPRRWCDNLSNNDPFVLELASKAVAYVVFKLANRQFR